MGKKQCLYTNREEIIQLPTDHGAPTFTLHTVSTQRRQWSVPVPPA